MSEMFDPDSYPILWVQSRGEISARLNFQFARKYLRRCCIRLTGGCGHMDDKQRAGLDILRAALEGFDGVGLFGGTSMRLKADPRTVLDTVTEVFPSLRSRMFKIGVVAKHSDMRLTPYGVVIGHDERTFTLMHSGANALLAVQPSVDKPANYIDEADECLRLCDELQQVNWNAVLVVYNGGKVTEEEVLKWAALGREQPDRWKVLIINGSGRTADRFAEDEAFLKASPTVRVVELDAVRIREALVQFEAFNPTHESENLHA